MLVVVTGVAGSGKSSLINGSVSGRDGVVTVDQTPIRGSRRSNPATYTGLTDAEEFFGAGEASTPVAQKILRRMADVGLGYVSLGQRLTTLSGGERQRLKLATQVAAYVG